MGVEKMNCLVKPYEGEKPYIFFSYCHEDSGKVYPVIERMAREGYRIWYDDGIHPGDDWPQVIAEHIERADVCIAAISENSSRSHSCKKQDSALGDTGELQDTSGYEAANQRFKLYKYV